MTFALEDLIGRSLGDFVLRQRLGEGGFGEVFLAEQPRLGREAVVKILHRRYRASEMQVQRFLREARLASRLDHPYAAHVYAFGEEDDGLVWIAMEYVRGQTLTDRLRAQGPMALDALVPLLEQICEVLQAAHDLGIVHRDIKPPNVMVVERSRRLFPKLLDFGIAKLALEGAAAPVSAPAVAAEAAPLARPARSIASRTAPQDLAAAGVAATASFVGAPGGLFAAPGGDVALPGATAPDVATASDERFGAGLDPALTQAGAAIGSPPYMAPEQWADAATATARTDLYAVGVLTYEALTGRRPFDAPTAAAYAYEHATTPVPALPAGLPPALDEVFARVMAKDAAARYGSALEFAAALRNAAGLGSPPLPRLDDGLRQAVEGTFPQPLAEAVALFHAARNAHQARDTLREVVTIAVRLVATIALAASTQVGGGASSAVVDALRELHRRSLSDAEWAALARALVATLPIAGEARQAYPVPELLELFAPTADDGGDLLGELTARHSIDGDALLAVRRALPPVTRLLRALTFLADYPLVVVEGGMAESWMGVRRPKRVALALSGPSLEPGRPALLDGRGRPRVVLWPLIQIAAPLPGAPPELFLLDGRGRRGARMVAMPSTLERHDEAVWAWLVERLGSRDEAATTWETGSGEAPYRGLAAFTAGDAEAFVGREREVEVAVNRLRVAPLLAVVGPSGAGKSSFVHAGLVPALPESWRVISMRPGPQPLAALEARLRRAGIAVEGLAAAPERLREALAGRGTTVLVIDQLEELFTLGAPLEEQRAFARALAAATVTADDPVRVIVTLRDDFLARATQVAELRERLPAAMFLLGTPGEPELIRILTEPLAKAGVEFEDAALPARMVREVAETPGALALLSFTAAQLWALRDRHFRQLTVRAYEALGGVVGALAKHAEATLDELGASELRLARIALSHLITAEGTRAVLSRGELRELLAEPGGDGVIEKLISARLLTATEAEVGGDRVELIHEALVTAWPRLATWRREDAEGARLRDQVRAAARQWAERGRPSGLLWRGEALAELQVWRARHPARLTEIDEAFIGASLAEARRNRRIRRGLVVGAFLVLGAGLLVMTSLNARTEAERARAEAERGRAEVALRRAEASERVALEEHGRQLFLDGDLYRAATSLAAARAAGAHGAGIDYLIDRTFGVLGKLRRVLVGHRGAVRRGAFLRDGRAITIGEDGTTRLWDVGRGEAAAVRGGPSGRVDTFAISPDERLVATSHADHSVRLWDLRARTEGVTLAGHTASISAMQFSADGRALITASADRSARVWDIASGALIATLPHAAGVVDARFDATGAKAFTLSTDGELVEWSLSTGARLRVLATAADPLRLLSPSPDGTALVSGAAGGRFTLWDLATGTRRREFALQATGEPSAAGPRWVEAPRFSADGRQLAVADGAQVVVWEVATGEIRRTLKAPVEVTAVAFAPGDLRIAVATGDAVRLWEVASGQLLATIPTHVPAEWIAFSPDGTALLLGGHVGGIEVWSTAADLHVRQLRGLGELAFAVSLSEDGRRVAACGEHGAVRVWDVAGDAPSAAFSHGALCEVLLVDGGGRAFTGGDDGRVVGWDVARGVIVSELAPAHGRVDVLALAGRELVVGYSEGPLGLVGPDGQLTRLLTSGGKATYALASHPVSGIASCGLDGALRVWRPEHGARPALELPREGMCAAVGWSPDGRQLAAANVNDLTLFGFDGVGLHAGPVCRGHTNRVVGITYPRPGLLLTAAVDGTVRVWEAATGNLLDVVPAAGGIGALDGAGEEFVTAVGDAVDVWRLPPPISSDVLAAIRARLVEP